MFTFGWLWTANGLWDGDLNVNNVVLLTSLTVLVKEEHIYGE